MKGFVLTFLKLMLSVFAFAQERKAKGIVISVFEGSVLPEATSFSEATAIKLRLP